MKKTKKLVFLLFLGVLWGCSQQEQELDLKTVNKKNVNQRVGDPTNENLLAKTLLYTQWETVPSIMSRNYGDLRNGVIYHLDNKCNETLTYLQSLSDYELVWRGALPYKFLLDASIRTSAELLNMSLGDYLNCIIVENKNNTSYTIAQLQGFTVEKNLNIAYGWWFYQNTSIKNKIDKLNNVSNSSPIFDIKENRNLSMQCLKIIKANETYTYLGVYHNTVGANHYKLYLAGSNDLQNWTFIADLGDRSHQGDIKKWGNGYVLANEQDPVLGSNNIRVRYYSSYANLIANNASNDKSITRNFSATAEGTPDIRVIEGSTPTDSHIVIGFHYFENGVRDQQAIGILYHFTSWRAWKDEISNTNIQSMGYNGNIGGRSSFSHSGDFVLQEAQQTSNDWSSWRLLLGNGAFYYTLNMVTPLGSISFANPGIGSIGNNQFVVTSFMPTEGNQNGEIGELRYAVQF